MRNHYKVIYQKFNGDIFERHRITLPDTKIGDETSMGWKILDIKVYFKYRWYSLNSELAEYRQAQRQDLINERLYWDLKEWA